MSIQDWSHLSARVVCQHSAICDHVLRYQWWKVFQCWCLPPWHWLRRWFRCRLWLWWWSGRTWRLRPRRTWSLWWCGCRSSLWRWWLCRWIRLWWCLIARWWSRRWPRRCEPSDPWWWCWHCGVIHRDPVWNPMMWRFRWPHSIAKFQDLFPTRCCNLRTTLSSAGLSLREGGHEVPQGWETLVPLLDLAVVALFDVDDIVTMVLQDFRCQHQGRLDSFNIVLDLLQVRPCQFGKVPEAKQLLLRLEDWRRECEDAGEVIHGCCTFAAQLGVLLNEVVDRSFQGNRALVLPILVDLLIVASPSMSKMDDLSLPFIEHSIEGVLGPLSLPRCAQLELV